MKINSGPWAPLFHYIDHKCRFIFQNIFLCVKIKPNQIKEIWNKIWVKSIIRHFGDLIFKQMFVSHFYTLALYCFISKSLLNSSHKKQHRFFFFLFFPILTTSCPTSGGQGNVRSYEKHNAHQASLSVPVMRIWIRWITVTQGLSCTNTHDCLCSLESLSLGW